MSVVAFKKNIPDAALTIVTGTQKENKVVKDNACAKSETPGIKRGLFPAEIFRLTFSYAGRVIETQAMKTCYRNKQFICKIALNSSISSELNMCWLQHQPQGWELLLGHQLDKQLVSAIIAALKCRNFPGSGH